MPLRLRYIWLMFFGVFLGFSYPYEAQGHCPLEKLSTTLPWGGLWYFLSSSSITDYSSDISGTPDCRHKRFMLGQREVFFIRNYHYIAEEASQGGGNYLNALATLIGCPRSSYPVFTAVLKRQYRHLFKAQPPVDSLVTLKKLETLIVSHQPLNQVCYKG